MVNTPNLPKLVGEANNLLLSHSVRATPEGNWVSFDVVGEKPVTAHPPRAQKPSGSDDDVEAEFGKKASRWVQQNGISISAIEKYFMSMVRR